MKLNHLKRNIEINLINIRKKTNRLEKDVAEFQKSYKKWLEQRNKDFQIGSFNKVKNCRYVYLSRI